MGSRDRLSLRHALALGLAHGPSELLPVSSSAHTILIPWLAGWPYAELDPELRKSFEVALHAGTAAALLTDLRSIEHRPRLATVARAAGTRQALLVALSFIPPAVAGYTFEQFLQRRLSGPPTIAAGLLLGGAAMALADARPQAGTHTLEQASVLDGLALGVAQACALVPGVSRSGAVLTAARARGFSRADSYTLARRTGLPVILGAGVLKTGRLLQRTASGGPPISGALALGAGTAFLSTLAATRLLRRDSRGEQTAPLLPYALYRGLLSALVVNRLRRAHNRSA
ncbi:MAG TPA: undecaprenyl-diphosphate phosphatase [Solirubrobacteraceae bacterium]|nr:undecaprenyl-diphosphate phosphatase [Solirubrobacteraceae bacterium]